MSFVAEMMKYVFKKNGFCSSGVVDAIGKRPKNHMVFLH